MLCQQSLQRGKWHCGLEAVYGATASWDGTITIYCQDAGPLTPLTWLDMYYPLTAGDEARYLLRWLAAVLLSLQLLAAVRYAREVLGVDLPDLKMPDLGVAKHTGALLAYDNTAMTANKNSSTVIASPRYASTEVVVRMAAKAADKFLSRNSQSAKHPSEKDCREVVRKLMNQVNPDKPCPAANSLWRYADADVNPLSEKSAVYILMVILAEMIDPTVFNAEVQQHFDTGEHSLLRQMCAEEGSEATAFTVSALLMSCFRDPDIMDSSSCQLPEMQELSRQCLATDPDLRLGFHGFKARLLNLKAKLLVMLSSRGISLDRPMQQLLKQQQIRGECAAPVTAADMVLWPATPTRMSIYGMAGGAFAASALTYAAAYDSSSSMSDDDDDEWDHGDTATTASHSSSNSRPQGPTGLQLLLSTSTSSSSSTTLLPDTYAANLAAAAVAGFDTLQPSERHRKAQAAVRGGTNISTSKSPGSSKVTTAAAVAKFGNRLSALATKGNTWLTTWMV